MTIPFRRCRKALPIIAGLALLITGSVVTAARAVETGGFDTAS